MSYKTYATTNKTFGRIRVKKYNKKGGFFSRYCDKKCYFYYQDAIIAS